MLPFFDHLILWLVHVTPVIAESIVKSPVDGAQIARFVKRPDGNACRPLGRLPRTVQAGYLGPKEP